MKTENITIEAADVRKLLASASADAALSSIDMLHRLLKNSPYVQGEKKQLIDIDYTDEVRERLPLLSARRTDIYDLWYNE